MPPFIGLHIKTLLRLIPIDEYSTTKHVQNVEHMLP